MMLTPFHYEPQALCYERKEIDKKLWAQVFKHKLWRYPISLWLIVLRFSQLTSPLKDSCDLRIWVTCFGYPFLSFFLSFSFLVFYLIITLRDEFALHWVIVERYIVHWMIIIKSSALWSVDKINVNLINVLPSLILFRFCLSYFIGVHDIVEIL